MVKPVVRCTEGTQCTAGLSCDQTIIQYTHDEYCNMLLTLGSCNSRAVNDRREFAQCYPVRRLRETRSMTCKALVNAARPRTVRTPVDWGAIIAAVERQPWKISRDIVRELGMFQQRVCWARLAISWIHTAASRMHICCQAIVLLRLSCI
jgi:hypothetical protein